MEKEQDRIVVLHPPQTGEASQDQPVQISLTPREAVHLKNTLNEGLQILFAGHGFARLVAFVAGTQSITLLLAAAWVFIALDATPLVNSWELPTGHIITMEQDRPVALIAKYAGSALLAFMAMLTAIVAVYAMRAERRSRALSGDLDSCIEFQVWDRLHNATKGRKGQRP